MHTPTPQTTKHLKPRFIISPLSAGWFTTWALLCFCVFVMVVVLHNDQHLVWFHLHPKLYKLNVSRLNTFTALLKPHWMDFHPKKIIRNSKTRKREHFKNTSHSSHTSVPFHLHPFVKFANTTHLTCVAVCKSRSNFFRPHGKSLVRWKTPSRRGISESLNFHSWLDCQIFESQTEG